LQGGGDDLNGNEEATGRESGDPKGCSSVASCCAHASRSLAAQFWILLKQPEFSSWG